MMTHHYRHHQHGRHGAGGGGEDQIIPRTHIRHNNLHDPKRSLRGLDLRTAVITNQQKVGRVTHRQTPTRHATTTLVTKPTPRDQPVQNSTHRSRREDKFRREERVPTSARGNSDRHLPEIFINSSGEKYVRTSQLLGEGGFSVCYLVKDQNDLPMAGKFFTRKVSSGRKRLERFEKEVNMMKSLHHPNIVKFYDAISGVKGNRTLDEFHRNDQVGYQHPPVMFLEYCSGESLSAFLKSRADIPEFAPPSKLAIKRYGTLDQEETLWVASCVCKALDYLMNKHILHRDIKLGNLLLQHPVNPNQSIVNSGIVLCDFGLATQLKDDKQLAFGTAGTPYYIAREVILHEGASYASDIWSLGITLFYCLTGRAPFNSRSRSTSGIYRKIRRMAYRWKSAESAAISPEIRDLVDAMISEEPNDRPTPQEVLNNYLISEKSWA